MQEYPSSVVKSYDSTKIGNQKMSRYKDLKILVNKDGNNYIESPVKKEIIESNYDSFYTVEPSYEDRIDLVSNKFYGTPFLWWAIAMINHIKNPMRLEVGIVLRIPPMSHII